jgi:AraC-like DNA-binding protein
MTIVEQSLMMNSGKPRGILNLKAAKAKFQLTRYLPASDVEFFVQRFWVVQWDLHTPYVQENLAYPCVNLVLEKGKDNSRIYGPTKGKYAKVLEGKGRVFGIKFRPGAFYPFVKYPISQLTDSSMSLYDTFGVESTALETILTLDDERDMVELAESFIRARLPEHDENVAIIHQIVDCIVDDRTIRKVDDVVNRLNLNKRTLQRLFSQYVGISPKWVIKQYRLHEAATQLTSDTMVLDMPKMALELGYFDQAHFIKDFKTVVGSTPMEYAKRVGAWS